MNFTERKVSASLNEMRVSIDERKLEKYFRNTIKFFFVNRDKISFRL